MRGAAEGITRLSLELGGHAPVLIFEDADLDKAVQGTLIAKFRNTGQSCIAANRVYIHGLPGGFVTGAIRLGRETAHPARWVRRLPDRYPGSDGVCLKPSRRHR
ncbi:MAG: aldehyde dehydrogenase family protein [Pirellulales bacterium]|nr:aldehyde dehydrogenase family protein [Pirellulales bacterium]